MDSATINLLCEKGFIPKSYRDAAIAATAETDQTAIAVLNARREEIAALMSAA
jgi:hypothetical protein